MTDDVISFPASARLHGVDGRTRAARRQREAFEQLYALSAGRGVVETIRVEMATRGSCLTVMVEHLETKMLAGEDIDPDSYLRAVGALGRCYAALGLKEPTKAPPVDRQAALDRLRNRQDAPA